MNYLKLLAFYLVLVFILHVIPTGPSEGGGLALSSRVVLFIRADYLLHLLIFVPLMVLVWLHLNKENITGRTRFNHTLYWLAAGVLFAAFVEGVQCLLAHRAYNPVDLILNVSGVLLGAVIMLWKPKRYAKIK